MYGYIIGDGFSLTWVVGTLISLLAAGSGTVALIKYFKPRSKFRARFWLPESSSYQISRAKKQVTIRPDRERVSRLNEQSPKELLFPVVNVSITNRSGEAKSLNTLEFVFSELKVLAGEQTGPPTVGIKFKKEAPAAGIDALVRRHSLVPAGTKGPINLYRLPAQKAVEVALAAIRQEQDLVEFAAMDTPGELHRKWPRAETVDLNLAVARHTYAYHVGHTLSKYETLPVKVSISAEESLRGRAAVNLIYDGGDVASLGTLDIEVIKLPFLHTAERKKNAASGT